MISLRPASSDHSYANLTQVKFYLDFDGTLSDRKGSQCVFSNLYRSLQLNSSDSYEVCHFKQNMVDLLRAGFTLPENRAMRMSKGALKFLEDMITEGAEVNIISRNRKEYIRAVLSVEGMDSKQIEKITIRDVNDLISSNGKYLTVLNMEQSKTKPAKVAVVCDDDPSDCEAMKKAVTEGDAKASLISYSTSPGAFDWPQISQDVYQRIGVTQDSKMMPVTPKEAKVVVGKFFSEQSSSLNDPKRKLADALNKGIPMTYEEREGSQYLVFEDKDREFFSEAVTQLRLNQYQEANESNSADKAYDFRIAAQPLTLEVRRQITIDAGKLLIASPLDVGAVVAKKSL